VDTDHFPVQYIQQNTYLIHRILDLKHHNYICCCEDSARAEHVLLKDGARVEHGWREDGARAEHGRCNDCARIAREQSMEGVRTAQGLCKSRAWTVLLEPDWRQTDSIIPTSKEA
jgi:hypothetical protein